MIKIKDIYSQENSLLSSFYNDKYVDKKFINEYEDIVFNSSESINFHLKRSEQYLNSIDNNKFSIECIESSLRSEEYIDNIGSRLTQSKSVESLVFAGNMLKSYGLESGKIKEKVVKFSKTVMNALKEAFKKLRLALANIISAFRKWVAKLGSRNYDYLLKKEKDIKKYIKIREIKDSIIQVKANKPNDPFDIFPDFFTIGFTFWGNIIDKLSDQILTDLESMNSKSLSLIRYADYTRIYKERLVELISQSYNSKTGEAILDERSSFSDVLIYGTSKPKVIKIKLGVYFKDVPFGVLSRSFVTNLDNSCVKINKLINVCNKAITRVETLEKESLDEKSIRNKVSQVLKSIREFISKLIPITRNLFIEVIKVRHSFARCCRMILNKGISLEKSKVSK